jgi:DNA-binding transcriptional ArsR family regulator
MPKEKFVLVSLKENKAKELAKVISNESCRKILDYLAENNDATETQLAEKLQLPISTVHYNLKHLLAGGLITADEYHYSEKGKEVNHYKLANKYIIIAPKTTYGIKEKLKSILPVGLIALVTTGFIQLYLKYIKKPAFGVMKVAQEAAPKAIREAPRADNIAAPLIEEAETIVAEEATKAAAGAAETATEPILEGAVDQALTTATEKAAEAAPVMQEVIVPVSQPNYALWFLIGCLFVLVLVVVFELIRTKKEK